ATPPDPSGAVGPNHYINAVNSVLKIFDKSGNLLVGPTALGSFLGNGTNGGDPIIMYDHLADRFFVSQFGSANNSLVLGVSETSDPTGAYFVYEFVFNNFPDYPHYSVWHDGYYLTANKSGEVVYVLERDVILNGGEDPQIVGFSPPGLVFNPGTVKSLATSNMLGSDYPENSPGYITYLQDDGWDESVTFDHLKIWEVNIDWVSATNSTISDPIEVPLNAFDSVFAPFGSGDLVQPETGQKIDMIGGVISYAANYRMFENHNSWVITFNVDVDGNDTAGIRWVELRNNTTDAWTVYQEGTYAPDDGNSRFMGSSAIDIQGNIGLGFNIGSPTLPVGISYTGRYESDPLGEMTQTEMVIVDGVGVQTYSNRFGDYSHLTMDPDGFTFWHTAEYFKLTNEWQSRIGSFRLSAGFENDLSVADIINLENDIFTNSEPIEVKIRNLGTENQSDFPIELYLDGDLVATETFSETINVGEVAEYRFDQTLDLSTQGQTYNIRVKVILDTDQYSINDEKNQEVRHLFNNDIGIVSFDSPESGIGLSDEEVSVTIKNYGADTQSFFEIQYAIDGGVPVLETVAEIVNPNETLVYNFSQTADLSSLVVYSIEASVILGGDQFNSNNTVTTEVENKICAPTMNCSLGDGIQLFSIADINNVSGCEGYGDFTNLTANLIPGNTYPLTITTGYGNQNVTVWIDFNNDNDFTADEKIVNNFVIAPGETGGSYTETIDVTIPASSNLGSFTMRAKTNWDDPVPEDACVPSNYGETEDYTVNTETILNTSDFSPLNNSKLTILDKGDKQYEAVLTTAYDGPAYIAIYNLKGQQLKFKKIVKSSVDSYVVRLDMSQVSTGMYIIRIGGKRGGSYFTEKFIVK
ncbi:GEVED domain-containing protein, partial [bacterium]|nr:GEVED domain-containing protein [bacterium]